MDTTATANFVQQLTQLTFVTTCLTLGAGSFFFYSERNNVHPRYRLPLLLATIICGIACIMYYYMLPRYIPGQSFPTQYRYIDWLVTTPIMLLEFTALLNFKDRVGAMVKLVLWDLIMIAAGYVGETQGFALGGFQLRWVMFVVSCGGWLGVLVYLYSGIKQQAVLSDTETRRCVMLLTKFVTLGWCIYPAGYIVRAVFPDLSDYCQLMYNIGDVVNKVGFGIVVYATGVYALGKQTHTSSTKPAAAPLDIASTSLDTARSAG